jgi:signal transduction histidine kinase
MLGEASTRRSSPILISCMALPLYCTAVIRYTSLLATGREYVHRLAPEFFAILTIAVLISLLLLIVKRQKYVILLLAVKFILTSLVGIPLSTEPTILLVLIAIVVLEVQMHLTVPANLVTSCAVAITATLLLREYFVWNEVLPGPTLLEKAQFFCLLALTALAGYLLRTLLDQRTVLRERAGNLEMTVSRLISANREFQHYALLAGKAAEREERMRISRDIHDTVGYTLTNLIVMMESATDFSRIDPEKAEELLDRAREIAIKGLEDTRGSLRLLRSVYEEDPSGLRMIQKVIDTFARVTGIDIVVEYGNLPWTMGQEIDEAVYHIVQESLINAFRHGRATKICILFWLAEKELRISVSDNGRGSKAIKEGIGFQGIQERLCKLGGSFQAGNCEEGFGISVGIPFQGARRATV